VCTLFEEKILLLEQTMAIASAREMLLNSTRGKYSVGAFNITNIIQMEAVVEAAERKNAPLIIQTSVTPAECRATTG
jgi:fructose/tagatose bisphosphate aldolase